MSQGLYPSDEFNQFDDFDADEREWQSNNGMSSSDISDLTDLLSGDELLDQVIEPEASSEDEHIPAYPFVHGNPVSYRRTIGSRRPIVLGNPVARPGARCSKHRAFCWTINNPIAGGDFLLAHLKNAKIGKQVIDFAVFQLEKGENGTPHFQGFCHWTKDVGFNSMAKVLPSCHLLAAEGSAQQNQHYCTKPVDDCACEKCVDCPDRLDGPWTFGDIPVQGFRSDLAQACAMITAGTSIPNVARELPTTYAQYAKGLYAFKVMTIKPKAIRDPPDVRLYIGPTGTGKTWKALSEFPNAYLFSNLKTWEGYQDEKEIIFDDFSGKHNKVELATLLRLLDRYRCIVDVKFMSAYIAPEVLVITTNIHPFFWYDYSKRMEQFRALTRRFSSVHLFTPSGTYDVEPVCPNKEDFFMHPDDYGFASFIE